MVTTGNGPLINQLNRDDRMTEREEMDAAELALRKFLKQVGVTAHQELAKALADAVQSGRLKAGDKVPVKASIELDGVDFTHQVTGELVVPE